MEGKKPEEKQIDSSMQDLNIGPELPPELATGMKVEDKAKSELKNSINKKGGNSYYYAHNYDGQNFNNENAKQFYGDGLIYGGEPTLISSGSTKEETKQEKKVVKKIEKYSWLDEDKKVKIYIELDQFPTKITKAMIEVAFEDYAVNIRVVDESGTEHILKLSTLYEKIEASDSSFRHSDKRISISMVKWLETKWTTLFKEKK